MRVKSIDALRGLDMLLICGLAAFVVAACQWAGHPDCGLVRTLDHCCWSGFHLLDGVFPLFIFLAGASFPFSCQRRRERGMTRGGMTLAIFRRMALLVLLGAVYNGFFTDVFTSVPRYASVLGRIGLAWGLAALLYVHFGLRTRAAVAVLILVGYWAFQAFVPCPDASALEVVNAPPLDPYWMARFDEPHYLNGPFSINGCWNGWFDRHFLPGRLLFGGPNYGAAQLPTRMLDPEGLLSTLPAAVTALLGMFAGDVIRSTTFSPRCKVGLLAFAGGVCGLLALAWTPWCPVVKNLWTSTFVLVAGFWSFAPLALFYWLIDVRGWDGWAFPLRVVGTNAIAAYLLCRICDFERISAFFLGAASERTGLCAYCSPETASLLSAAGYLALVWSVLHFLYRKKAFFKV